jgi:hypothetical protein
MQKMACVDVFLFAVCLFALVRLAPVILLFGSLSGSFYYKKSAVTGDSATALCSPFALAHLS